MGGLKLYLLGPPRVELDGSPVDIQRRKALALLAYLAVSGQPHARDALATLFWPDLDQQRGRAYLRRDLAALNTSLPGDWLMADRETLELNREANSWLDIEQFRRCLAACRAHSHPPEAACPSCLPLLTEAAALYTGDFLAGFTLRDSPEFDDWQFFQTESLRQELAAALERLAQGLSAQGQAEAAIPHARRWVALDPLHEPAQRLLIRLYDQAGQPAAGLRQYEEYVKLLDEELGLPPEEETATLYEAIKAKRLLGSFIKAEEQKRGVQARRAGKSLPENSNGDGAAAAAGPEAEPRPAGFRIEEKPAPPGPELKRAVGREAELAKLNEALEQARSGRRQLLFITGEAGLGKTTLVETFLEEARANTTLWIGRGQCIEHRGAGEAYMPVLEALGRMAREPGGQALISLLTRVAPTWLVQMPWLISPEELEAVQQRVLATTRERMLREMGEAVEMLTATQPLILVLEDLHWSDYSTLDLLTWLARRPEPARLLLLGTYRPSDVKLQDHPLRAVVQEIQLRGQGVEVPLPLLTPAAVETYLAQRFGPANLPAGLAPLLHRRTAGNPLFIRTLVEAWIAHGALAVVEGRWVLRVGLEALMVGVPETLRQLIEQQFGQLNPADQTILEVASVAGLEFATAVVQAGLDLSEEEIERRCLALAQHSPFCQAAGLAEWADGTIAAQFKFNHYLYQEVLYERIPASRKVRLHRQIGQRLEAGYGAGAPGRAAELALHFGRGRDPARAVRYLHFAAEQAIGRNAYREAIEHLRQGLELLQSYPDLPERSQLELALQATLGPALIMTRGWAAPEAEQAYIRARELCQRLGDTRRLSSVLYSLASMYELRGQYLQSQALLQERLQLPHNPQDYRSQLESYELLACSTFHQGAFTQALTHADYALNFYNPHDIFLTSLLGENLAVSSQHWAGLALWFLGYPDQALARSQQALHQAKDLVYTFSLAQAHAQAAMLHQLRREEQAVYQQAEITIVRATQGGFAFLRGVGLILRGWAVSAQGEAEQGLAQLRQGLDICQTTGATIEQPYFLYLLADACGRTGRLEEGLAALAEAFTLARQNGDFFHEAELHRLQGELLQQLDPAQNLAAAADSLQQALDTARRQQAKMLELRAAVSLGRLWREQGREAEARQLLEELYGRFSEGFETADLQEAKRLLEALGGKVKSSRQAAAEISLLPPLTPAAGVPSAGDEAKDVEPINFVARERELARLNAWLEAALAGQFRVAFITGEAGLGKSALLQAFVSRAQAAHPALIAVGGKCNAYTGLGDPYLPFREMMALLAGDIEARAAAGALPREQARRLGPFFPHLVQAVLEVGPELLDTFIPAKALFNRAAAQAPKDAPWVAQLHALMNRPRGGAPQSGLFEQYGRVLQRLSREAPLLLFLDDLQWADSGSTHLLFHLARQLAGCRILILGAYRPDEVEPGRGEERHPLEKVRHELQRDFGEMTLDLSQAEGRAFVEAWLDSQPNQLDHSFREMLYRQTGGQPLFTVELLRDMQERGELRQNEAGIWLAQARLNWQTLPARVEGAIGERISRLPAPLRDLLQVASVEGEEFSAEVVAQALDAPIRTVVRQLSTELDKTHRLVQVLGMKQVGARRLSRYRFRHILMQRYLYNSLDEIEKSHLNEMVGNVLEALYAGQTEQAAVQLARYYQEAGHIEKAVAYLLQAGTQASSLSAHAEALAHLRQALALLQTLPDSPERAGQELKLLIALGTPLIATKSFAAPEVGKLYQRAWELCQQTGAREEHFRVLWHLWVFSNSNGDWQNARERAEQLLALAGQTGQPDLYLQAYHALWTNSYYGGDFAAVHAHTGQGIQLYHPQQHGQHALIYGGHDPGVCAWSFSALALWHLGYPEQALARSRQAIELARQRNHPHSLANALIHATRLRQFCGDVEGVKALAQEAIPLCQAGGFVGWLAYATALAGWALVEEGQVEAGLAQIRHSLENMRATQQRLWRLNILALLVEAGERNGEIESGLLLVDEALMIVAASDARQIEAELYRLKGKLLLAQDDPLAENCFLKAVDIARGQQAKSLELRAAVSLGLLWRKQDREAEARQMLEELYDWFSEGFETADLQEARALLETLGGEVQQKSRGAEEHPSPSPRLPAPLSPLGQQIGYCRTAGGVRLAYATVGQGSPLVKAANWLSHLEYEWQSPVWRHWLEGLARRHTLIRYDKRGCGLSDREVADFALSAQVADLETVVDALGLARFPLLGLSGGGPVALAYAARHPEKVSHLILYGSYVRGRLKRSQTMEQLEEVQMLLKVMELGWGKANPAFRQVYTGLFIPEGTAEQMHWFNDLQRISTSPEIAVRMAIASYSVDVSDLASQITAPTLVLHARDDAVVPLAQSRGLAELIPGARLVILESKNHILLEHEPAWPQFLAEVDQFVQTESALPNAAAQPSPFSSREKETAATLAGRPETIPLIIPDGKRFIQEKLLAVGGMGQVYLGHDTQTGRPVAIKRLKPELVAHHPEAVQRLIREGDILRQLNHPNIIRVLATLENEGEPLIVMEYLPGGSLKELLDRQPQLPLERALHIGLELADALARVHHLGILHRDLKPANVLLTEEGAPRLTDFGVAYLAQTESKLTQEGAILGTTAYLSPEAWRGEVLDARSDIWSFGAVLYEMLAGRPPFAAEHAVAIMTATLNNALPDLRQFRPDTPPALVELIKHMLVKERELRLDSMRQVAAGLEVIHRSLTP